MNADNELNVAIMRKINFFSEGSRWKKNAFCMINLEDFNLVGLKRPFFWFTSQTFNERYIEYFTQNKPNAVGKP